VCFERPDQAISIYDRRMRRKPSEILKEAPALPPDVRAQIKRSGRALLKNGSAKFKGGLQKWSRVRSKPFRGVMRVRG
jgi:hypothetical protein